MTGLDSLTIRVRAGDPERDLQALVALNAFVQDLHVAQEPMVFRPSSDMPDLESFHLSFMHEQDRHTFVAEAEGRVVGYVSLEVERREAHTFCWRRERLYVHQLSVHPDYRRRGVGRALMNRVDALAADLGVAEVALDTWQFNSEGRRFFEGLGYTAYNIRLRKHLGE